MFNWLFKPLKFRRFDDSFALSREGFWNAIGEAIQSRLEMGELVFVVAHFPETFSQLQTQIEAWSLEYEVERKSIDHRWFKREQTQFSGKYENQLFVVLASQLAGGESEPIEDGEDSRQVSMVVVERHPVLERDLAIEQFCKNIPYRVQLGYFVSLQDAFIQRILGNNMVKLMATLGMNESELVSSIMLTQRIKKLQARFAKQISSDHPADSVEEWFELNALPSDVSASGPTPVDDSQA